MTRRIVHVVDDSRTARDEAIALLGRTYDVRVFADGPSFLEALASEPPAVVVLDWVMEGMTGIEVLQFIRSQPMHADIAVLMLTVKHDTEQVVEVLEAGAN